MGQLKAARRLRRRLLQALNQLQEDGCEWQDLARLVPCPEPNQRGPEAEVIYKRWKTNRTGPCTLAPSAGTGDAVTGSENQLG